MEEKWQRDWPALAIAAVIMLLLAPPALYLCGYFWLADVGEGVWLSDETPIIYLTYGAKWLMQIYGPAGRIEERLTNRDVEIGCQSP